VEWDESMKMDMPLTGANVYWLNTTDGVNSDVKGNFSLPYDGKNSKLVVSFVGFQMILSIVHDASFLKVT
jgi:hypothetical protein